MRQGSKQPSVPAHKVPTPAPPQPSAASRTPAAQLDPASALRRAVALAAPGGPYPDFLRGLENATGDLNGAAAVAQRRVFKADINEKPLDEKGIEQWYLKTFGTKIPQVLLRGLTVLVDSQVSTMLNTFSSEASNFLDLLALTMAESNNKSMQRDGGLWLEKRRKQIEAESEDPGPTFDRSGLVQLVDEKTLKIFIDSHQDKHQHPDSVLYGAWTHKRGSSFASGKGKSWHASNTAQTMKNYALKLELTEGQKVIPKKVPLDDGYIYDAAIMMLDGVIYVIYHCNPPESE